MSTIVSMVYLFTNNINIKVRVCHFLSGYEHSLSEFVFRFENPKHGLAFEEPVGSAGGSNAVAENTLNPIGTGLQTRENRNDPDGFLEAIWIGLESEIPH